MALSRYSIQSDSLDERTVRLGVAGVDGPLSWRGLLAGWANDSLLADSFSTALAGLPFAALRWETPAITAGRLDDRFECVAVDDPSLDVPPDPSPFAGKLRDDRHVVRFANLGGDAEMIVPCRQGPESAYAHLAAFLRHAPCEQQRLLWRTIAETVLQRLGDRPLWLNTAGGGVAWLHVRLDGRPKYYAHAPYREASSDGGGA